MFSALTGETKKNFCSLTTCESIKAGFYGLSTSCTSNKKASSLGAAPEELT